VVHVHLQTFSEAKSSIALNNLSDYVPDNTSFKLALASLTNANYIIPNILGDPDSQSHTISISHFIHSVIS